MSPTLDKRGELLEEEEQGVGRQKEEKQGEPAAWSPEQEVHQEEEEQGEPGAWSLEEGEYWEVEPLDDWSPEEWEHQEEEQGDRKEEHLTLGHRRRLSTRRRGRSKDGTRRSV
jgi:hypothetical protein